MGLLSETNTVSPGPSATTRVRVVVSLFEWLRLPVLALMERVEGIEPSSPAWKAGVIAFIRYPQAIDFDQDFYKSDRALGSFMHTLCILRMIGVIR